MFTQLSKTTITIQSDVHNVTKVLNGSFQYTVPDSIKRQNLCLCENILVFITYYGVVTLDK